MDKLVHTRWSGEDGHPSDDELLLYIDGELSATDSADARTHLESCWSCRVRAEKIQEAISCFIDYRNQVLTPTLQSPPRGWRSFDRGLSKLVEESGKTSLFSDVLRHLEKVFSPLRFPAVPNSAIRTVGCALIGIIIVGSLLINFRHVPTVSASELLRKATEAQASKIRVTNQPVVYQRLQVRRRDEASSSEISVDWEIWNDMTNSRLRQSVADKEGHRVLPVVTNKILRTTEGARGSSGSELLGELEQIFRANHLDSRRPLSPASYQAWRDSIKEKHEVVTQSRLADDRKVWMLRVSPVEAVGIGQVAESLLVMRADDWHPIEQRLRIKAEKGERVYELTETAFDVVSLAALNPALFSDQQTASFSSPEVTPKMTASPLPTVAPRPSPTAIPPSVAASATATAELEMEVLQLLSQIGADLGEQVSVVRTAGNQLYVQGIVGTDKRKEEILRALDAVKNNPAMRIEVSTVAEAVEKERQRQQPPGIVVERQVKVENDSVPASVELRRHFAAHGAEVDEHIRRFANQILVRSTRAQQHAWALKRLSERFSPEELRRLAPDARAKWLSMMREHARALEQQTGVLRRDLQPIFPSAASSGLPKNALVLTDDVQLKRTVEQLFRSCFVVSKTVRANFTASTQTSPTLPTIDPEFWDSLNRIEHLTAAIQRAR